MLQALIDRELLEHAAIQEKLDRDPKVIGAIERARSLIVAQVYMQKRLANVARPDAGRGRSLLQGPSGILRQAQAVHPRPARHRGQRPDTRSCAPRRTAPRSLEEVAVWLDAHGVKFGRSQVTRSTADLNPELSKKLLAMSKGQLFSVREGERAMLLSIAEVREAPVPLSVAAPQITQYLATRKHKELAAAELERLRKVAKIEYLNQELAQGARAAPASMTAPRAAAPARRAAAAAAGAGGAPGAQPAAPDKAAVERGVSGLK